VTEVLGHSGRADHLVFTWSQLDADGWVLIYLPIASICAIATLLQFKPNQSVTREFP
jgi:hypothetical protein